MLVSFQKVPWNYYGFWTPPSTQKVPWEKPCHNNIALSQSTGTMQLLRAFLWRVETLFVTFTPGHNLKSTCTNNHEIPISDVPSHDIMQKAPGGSETTGLA